MRERGKGVREIEKGKRCRGRHNDGGERERKREGGRRLCAGSQRLIGEIPREKALQKISEF